MNRETCIILLQAVLFVSAQMEDGQWIDDVTGNAEVMGMMDSQYSMMPQHQQAPMMIPQHMQQIPMMVPQMQPQMVAQFMYFYLLSYCIRLV